MIKDDIILIADASGLSYYGMGKDREKFIYYLEAFATLVAAAKPWQGLTDEEIWSVVSRIGTSDSNVNPLTVLSDARAIEQRLKERNHD